jgi:neutral ceramidase
MIRIALSCFMLLLSAFAVIPAEQNSLRAGAARIDITPAAHAALPMSGYGGRTEGFKSIHDPLHVRTIVVDDGKAQAAIISCETLYFAHPLWERMTQRITAQTGIPRENILLAGVHTHAAPTLSASAGSPLQPGQAEYVAQLENWIVESARQAKANLQPARVGYGTGRALVNMNRRARDGEGGWMIGNNPDGVSDKTVTVVKFESEAGDPIAVFSNYGVHGTVLGPANLQISGDLPGSAARFVEAHMGEKVVAPWTSGTAGDQDPIYRVGTDFQNVTALGTILGEEIVRVARSIKTSPQGRVRAVQAIVTCPGKKTIQAPARGKEYKIEDADPVPIRLSLLVINDIAFAGISGEVLTNIGLRLKKEAPFNHTIVVTQCNGASGYLPDDAAYGQVSYEITATRVKPGCAENSIVEGFLRMMSAFF